VTRHAADPGFTLADRLAHPAPMTPLEVALVGNQVASELEAWHRGGTGHLALGPDRIEIRAADDGRLHARLRPADSTTADLEARYRAPELASDRPVGPAADVYSLGVVLLDGLLGHRADPPGVPEDLGSAWRYLLAGMIAESPADRPTAATVAHTLGQVPGVATAPAEPTEQAPAENATPRSKLLPGGAHVEPTPIELPRPSRMGRLRAIPGRRRPPEPDVRQHPDGE
jgi:eukaryotic-like serine/threonine-protein kinase